MTTLKLVEEIATLGKTSKSGYTLKLTKTDYAGVVKWDLRQWASNMVDCGKGIRLSDEEFSALRDAMKDLDLGAVSMNAFEDIEAPVTSSEQSIAPVQEETLASSAEIVNNPAITEAKQEEPVTSQKLSVLDAFNMYN